jgi:hypothetical protein
VALILFVVGLVLFLRRRRRGDTIAVPVALMVLALVDAGVILVSVAMLEQVFRAVERVSPADKATILAAGISEAMKVTAIGLAVQVPLLIGAWIVDRRLRKPREPELPTAAEAPPGTRCTAHPAAPATRVCSRCGAFMCAVCAQVDGVRCAACLTRLPAQ